MRVVVKLFARFFSRLARKQLHFKAAIDSRNLRRVDTMLKSTPIIPLSEFDELVFQTVVRPEHYLRNVMAGILPLVPGLGPP